MTEIKPGQMWRAHEGGADWLVTKVYRDGLDMYVILRKLGGSEQDLRRLKIQHVSEASILPGFERVED